MNMELTDYNKLIDEFEEMTKNAEEVQRKTLKKILIENAGTEYLLKSGLNRKTDPISFRNCVPLIDHDDLEPYIQRILDGDSSPILVQKPVTIMSVSSGTAQGRRKVMPFNDQVFENGIRFLDLSFAFRNKEFPIVKNGKALRFSYAAKPTTTKAGRSLAPITTNMLTHPQLKQAMDKSGYQFCSPPEITTNCSDFQQSQYCHLLSGLIQREEIHFINSFFAHTLIQAFASFELLWPDLCTDIELGSVNPKRVLSLPLRAAMSSVLIKPDPQMAASVREVCLGLRENGWKGLIPKVFPNANYVYAVLTGSMEHYLNKLKNYAGDLPLVASDYVASEGWIGLNVHPKSEPEETKFVVVPDMGYFEFLPLAGSNSNNNATSGDEDRTVGLTEVEVGQEYEPIITNAAGLYRYKLGDTVKVVGFHNSAPEIRIIGRKSTLLSITVDKTTEKDLHVSVEQATKLLLPHHVDLVDFTSHADKSTEPGHYVIFWELSSGDCDERVLKDCCDCLDKFFTDLTGSGYSASRRTGAIGPLELRVVRRGTFQKIQELYVGMGTTVSQFKVPRCVDSGNERVMKILGDNVVKNYFSTSAHLMEDKVFKF